MKKVKMLVSFLLFLLFTSSQVNAECSLAWRFLLEMYAFSGSWPESFRR